LREVIGERKAWWSSNLPYLTSDEMTYGTDEQGNGYLRLSPKENERFKQGEKIVKVSGDCHGDFQIVAQLVRKSFRPLPPGTKRARIRVTPEGRAIIVGE